MAKDLVIKVKDGDNTAVLNLTAREVEAAVSVCEGNGVENVFICKGDKGAAQIFRNEQNCLNFQNRAKIDYMFRVELEELKKAHLFKPKEDK